MSTVYATEPATSGRVILETSHGPIEIELWCRECPTTTRMFLQLCRDGYYDNVLFHRILPSTLIQCGARRDYAAAAATTAAGKQQQQQSWKEYRRDILQSDQVLKRQRYEVSSRLRFNHRGQVAMALPLQEQGSKNIEEADNNDDDDDDEEIVALQPQFFITLEEASYLDGKHVLFGTVTGPTIFNAMRIGRVDTDETTHEPVDIDEAPRIQQVKIVDNPIHNESIVSTPANKIPWKIQSVNEEDEKNKKLNRKRKGKLNVNVLSFGDEMQDDTAAAASSAAVATKRGIQSSHDARQLDSSTGGSNAKKSSSKRKLTGDTDDTTHGRETDHDISRLEPKEPQREENDEASPNDDSKLPPKFSPSANHAKNREEKATAEKPSQASAVAVLATDDAATAAVPAAANNNNPKKKPKVSALQAARAKFLASKNSNNKSKQEREDYTLSKLSAFQDKVRDQVKAARNNQNNSNSIGGDGDTSLAARMARRAQMDDDTNPNNINNQAAAEQGETYRGQVLETTDDDVRDGSWLATRFKCRQHMDLTAGTDNNDMLVMGGDGRSADDYQVVDEQQARNSNLRHGDSRRDNNGERRHGHHHHHRRHHHHHHRRDDEDGKHRHGKR